MYCRVKPIEPFDHADTLQLSVCNISFANTTHWRNKKSIEIGSTRLLWVFNCLWFMPAVNRSTKLTFHNIAYMGACGGNSQFIYMNSPVIVKSWKTWSEVLILLYRNMIQTRICRGMWILYDWYRHNPLSILTHQMCIGFLESVKLLKQARMLSCTA